MLDLSHAYESLSSERFQALVATLVSLEHKRFQAMPLQGRDGGRDGIVMTVRGGRGDTLQDSLILQVKTFQYKQAGLPSNEQLYEWATSHIRKELPQVRQLIKGGVTEYIFATNIPGSGDRDAGVRDRVTQYLREHVSITASAWFREDIDTRLRGRPDIAARHGLILGTEGLRALLEMISTSPRSSTATPSKIAPALTAFFRKQYRDDARLRFRQVELDSAEILRNFVDVNVGGQLMPTYRRNTARQVDQLELSLDEDFEEQSFQRSTVIRRRSFEGAFAHSVLSGMPGLDRIVLDGAPGQGKSTTTQYICQVHRARFLQETEQLEALPEAHRYAPLRLPFRIELRKYASSPFARRESNQSSEKGVLSFLCAAITEASEIDITPSALVDTLISHRSILVLDGLDEVSDLSIRDGIIASTEQLAENLKQWKADCTLVITSRPSTLQATRPLEGIAAELHLLDLDRSAIDKYADKWTRHRQLENFDKEEFERALDEALDLPHVADLARNPMQLAILLFLVYARGWSLPEKRTELYDAYLDTFLTREAEKSPSVRNNRSILLELHGLLGWLLHSRVETRVAGKAPRGDIGRLELEQVLGEYLLREERDPGLIQELFEGVQRVFVLVERDEGRFEFEVQPLREFFAARHLYKTSPQAPAYKQVEGTRPDRLEALIRNPFWLNATRFFCGYYDKGELADLTRRLIDLGQEGEFRYSRYSRELLASVLRDYSLSENKRDTRELAAALVDELGLYTVSKPSVLFNPDTGLPQIVDAARSRLAAAISPEGESALSLFLRLNDKDVTDWWLREWEEQKCGSDPRWLRVGVMCGALPALSSGRLAKLYLDDFAPELIDWFRLLEAGVDTICVESDVAYGSIIATIASGPLSLHRTGIRPHRSPFTSLSYILGTEHLMFLRQGYDTPLTALVKERCPDAVQELGRYDQALGKLFAFITEEDLGTSIAGADNWHALVTSTRETFGNCWLVWRISLVGATHPRLASTNVADVGNGSIGEMALCHGMYRGRNSIDWLALVRSAAAGSDRPRLLAVIVGCFAWCPTDQVLSCLDVLVEKWLELEAIELRELASIIDRLLEQSTRTVKHRKLTSEDVSARSTLPQSILVVLSSRLGARDRDILLDELTERPDAPRAQERTFVSSELSTELLRKGSKKGWDEVALSKLAEYSRNSTSDGFFLGRGRRPAEVVVRENRLRISPENRRQVMNAPFDYPSALVERINSANTRLISVTTRPLADRASEEHWFSPESAS